MPPSARRIAGRDRRRQRRPPEVSRAGSAHRTVEGRNPLRVLARGPARGLPQIPGHSRRPLPQPGLLRPRNEALLDQRLALRYARGGASRARLLPGLGPPRHPGHPRPWRGPQDSRLRERQRPRRPRARRPRRQQPLPLEGIRLRRQQPPVPAGVSPPEAPRGRLSLPRGGSPLRPSPLGSSSATRPASPRTGTGSASFVARVGMAGSSSTRTRTPSPCSTGSIPFPSRCQCSRAPRFA